MFIAIGDCVNVQKISSILEVILDLFFLTSENTGADILTLSSLLLILLYYIITDLFLNKQSGKCLEWTQEQLT